MHECSGSKALLLCDQEAAKDGESVLDARKRKRLERDPLHQGLIEKRSHLKPRDYQIDLAARLGKTQVSELSSSSQVLRVGNPGSGNSIQDYLVENALAKENVAHALISFTGRYCTPSRLELATCAILGPTVVA